MGIVFITHADELRSLGELQVGALHSTEGIAEVLRGEVSSRTHCPRHFAIRRVCRAVAPVVSLDAGTVGEVCDELERQGDLLLSDGGTLFAAPLRIISLEENVIQIMGAVPSRYLSTTIPGEWTYMGVQRRCRAQCSATEIGGKLNAPVLTPQAWSGFEHTPLADGEFLDRLDLQLKETPKRPGSLHYDGPLEWQACEILPSGARWRREPPGSLRLWRARDPRGWWLYAWTGGNSPALGPFITVKGDESARATFALASTAGKPFQASIERTPEGVTIEIPAWLPRAEYRYLCTYGQPVRRSPAHASRWIVRSAALDSIQQMLGSRLGLLFDAPKQ